MRGTEREKRVITITVRLTREQHEILQRLCRLAVAARLGGCLKTRARGCAQLQSAPKERPEISQG